MLFLPNAKYRVTEGVREDVGYRMHLIQAGEGEKDPRNLALIFRCTAFILDNLNVHHLAEDIFESLAVYFPIGEILVLKLHRPWGRKLFHPPGYPPDEGKNGYPPNVRTNGFPMSVQYQNPS